MTVNKLWRCEHILFTAYAYYILAPVSPKTIIYSINICSPVKIKEEDYDPIQISKLFQKSGVAKLNNTHNLYMILFL